MTTEPAARATFRDVFAVSEFRAIWLAQLLSVAGDQLARVALTVLVYDRTQSALLAAITYVSSIVPTFVGGVSLAWLADRYPRRRVMIACDLIRCALVLVMAVRGVPLAAMVVLLFIVTLAGAPFLSARAAVIPEVLAGDRYVMGTAVALTTNQFAQVVGFAAGGAIAGFLGTGKALVIDAATFAGSALILRLWVRYRPAPQPGTAADSTAAGGAAARPARLAALAGGVRLVFGNAALCIPMLFGWLTAFYDAPEGVVTPLARSLGGGAVAVGIILASQALGVAVGAILFSRLLSPQARLAWMGPLAVVNCAVLMFMALRPPLAGVLVILAGSGLCCAYQLAANSAFVSAAPDEQRSQAFGLAVGGMSLGQGTVMIVAGAVTETVNPELVIAACGGLGAVTAALLAVSWSRSSARVRDNQVQPPVRTDPHPPTMNAKSDLLHALGYAAYIYIYDVADSWRSAACLWPMRNNRKIVGLSALVRGAWRRCRWMPHACFARGFWASGPGSYGTCRPG
jgi:MFS family permease